MEEALNAMLDAEAGRLCGAARYERREGRRDTRAGSYERSLHTKAGEVTLKVPKLRRQTFETAVIERYRRRESSVEEALIEMYLAGVSVRRVEDITEALWGTRVSPGTVSNLNKMPEVAGEAAILVDRFDVSSILSGLEVLSNDAIRKKLASTAAANAEKFNLKQSVEKLWELFHEAAEIRKNNL